MHFLNAELRGPLHLLLNSGWFKPLVQDNLPQGPLLPADWDSLIMCPLPAFDSHVVIEMHGSPD